MKHAAGALWFFLRFAILGLALAFVAGLLWPGSGERLRARFGLAQPTAATPVATAPAVVPAPASYADAVAAAAPSVVNIYANKIVTEQALRMYDNPLLQQLFGGQPTTLRHREQTLGSGVLVSAHGQGYVLTNNHVIAQAADIQVLLYDGRIAKASLVGADKESDLAVLRIAAGNLPVITLAKKPPRVGDVVLAIGNPLGLNQTVTMGIVSAVGRQLDNAGAEEFIQTDAAINLGNSGGALVNAGGELVGINTLLIGKAAGAEGIGFAIPVETARKVLDQIISTGHVVRGWLGAEYAFVPVPADSGLPAAARGALVTGVYPGGPAALAGLQPRDVLLRIGTEDIRDPADLRRHEAALAPGSKVTVSGLRNGAPFHVEVTLAQRPSPAAASVDAGTGAGGQAPAWEPGR